MKRALSVIVVLALLVVTSVQSQQPPGGPGSPPHPDDPLSRYLFPPELVMQQQQAIGLKPEQRTAITRAIKDFQGKVLDLQWQMQEETGRFGELLDKPLLDQAAALAQLDKVLAVEREVKRAHIGLLIQIKNQLTAEQQARLAQVRAGGP